MVADVLSNRLISEKNKYEIILICFLIFIASIFEYIGKKVNGANAVFINLHKAAKIIEFSVAPCIGIAAANAYGVLKYRSAMVSIISANIVFEIEASFNEWVFSIDSANIYHREKFYWIYIVIFLLSISCCYVCIISGNKKYQARLGIVNIFILIFLAFGIGIQMIYSNITVDFMCVAIGNFFLYHYRCTVMNQVDETTRLMNRRCFEKCKKNIKSPACVLFFDINNFKMINDTYGHAEGDKVLKFIAGKIFGVYGRYGTCYRIGGDEFCVVMQKGLDKLDIINRAFLDEIDDVCKMTDRVFGVALGYAFYDKNEASFDGAIKEADEMMYRNKSKCSTGRQMPYESKN